MKVSQLVISLLVLLMGAGLAMYSADQQKVMDVLVATHGGGPQVAAEHAGVGPDILREGILGALDGVLHRGRRDAPLFRGFDLEGHGSGSRKACIC